MCVCVCCCVYCSSCLACSHTKTMVYCRRWQLCLSREKKLSLSLSSSLALFRCLCFKHWTQTRYLSFLSFSSRFSLWFRLSQRTMYVVCMCVCLMACVCMCLSACLLYISFSQFSRLLTSHWFWHLNTFLSLPMCVQSKWTSHMHWLKVFASIFSVLLFRWTTISAVIWFLK